MAITQIYGNKDDLWVFADEYPEGRYVYLPGAEKSVFDSRELWEGEEGAYWLYGDAPKVHKPWYDAKEGEEWLLKLNTGKSCLCKVETESQTYFYSDIFGALGLNDPRIVDARKVEW